MKLKVMQSNLLPALTAAARAIKPRNHLPVLDNVLLDARDAEVILTTTNLELAYRIPVPAQVERPGRVTVPAKDLLKIVKGSSGLFEIEAQNLDAAQPDVTIKSGFVSRRIKGIDAEEFPNVDEEPEFSVNLVISAPELRDAINEVIRFAAAEALARPILYAGHLAVIGGKLTLTACNNFALASTTTEEYSVVQGEIGDPGFVIPSPNLAQVAKYLAKAQPGEVVTLGFGQKMQAVFGFEDRSRITSRLIDGIYPNWQQVMPPKGSGTTEVVVELSAMRELFAALDGNRHVRLTFADDAINAYRGDDESEFDASIPATVEGNLVSSFDPDYVRDVLSSISGERMTIQLSSPTAPALFYSDDVTQYVVMPVKTK